jgi:predicted phosphoadenosine phosphosulfate sulfurtransferase
VPGQLLPRRPVDADVYTLALERSAYTFEHFDHVAVSFSGGKDSTAVLNVALEVARRGNVQVLSDP